MRVRRRRKGIYGSGGGLRLDVAADAAGSGDACRHGGFKIGNILVCGKCGDPEHQLGLAILYIAKKVAFEVTGKTFTSDGVVGAVSLVLWLTREQIVHANNPGGLAFTIGRRAALRLYRNGRSVPAMAVGQMDFPADDDGKILETNTQRIDYLAGENEVEDGWQAACSARGRTFPYLGLVMNAANFLLLQAVIEEAKRKISLNVWNVIELRLDLYDDVGECLTWREISKLTPFNFNDLPEVYRQGLAVIRDHIVKRLMTKLTPLFLTT